MNKQSNKNKSNNPQKGVGSENTQSDTFDRTYVPNQNRSDNGRFKSDEESLSDES